jgi:hypothetical protein
MAWEWTWKPKNVPLSRGTNEERQQRIRGINHTEQAPAPSIIPLARKLASPPSKGDGPKKEDRRWPGSGPRNPKTSHFQGGQTRSASDELGGSATQHKLQQYPPSKGDGPKREDLLCGHGLDEGECLESRPKTDDLEV